MTKRTSQEGFLWRQAGLWVLRLPAGEGGGYLPPLPQSGREEMLRNRSQGLWAPRCLGTQRPVGESGYWAVSVAQQRWAREAVNQIGTLPVGRSSRVLNSAQDNLEGRRLSSSEHPSVKGPLEGEPERKPSWVMGGQLQVGVQGVSEGPGERWF